MYTSGTSGEPKGVVLTHEAIAFTIRGVDLFLEQFEDKVNTVIELLLDSLYSIIYSFMLFSLIFEFVSLAR